MKIGFYERVIIAESDRFPEYVGRTGVVLGISEDDTQVHSYSVFFTGEDEGVSFLPTEVKGTGEFVDRSQFYDDADRIKVRVEGEDGSISE
ncbi:Imm31 family immunity protein [Bradyrhizobium sp. NAS96.2]|uniref:Imm31 family immunity protein n=1 Tax=Bradyrhizobium sp. NAS96.2 TaxID=1680160 RepID=UPI00093DAD6B|nr:Imm31 family immunity protein [Bradyrhizobium sp. NAS96.2]OKO81358.1 hypothetical protein AC628_07025 [Bradyrhizobium sp. NAS96.2]